MKIKPTLNRPFQSIKKNIKESLGWLNFISHIKPYNTFEALAAPKAPDYNDLENWATHPEKIRKADFTPSNVASEKSEGILADVFFIHPTTYFGKNNWNAPMSHEGANEIVDEMIIPGQASVFNTCCHIYAPRYRQATFYSFLEGKANGRLALELAYTDIQQSFEHYLEHYNYGRPFFLAGHSQGTLHAIRLLEKRIDSSLLAKKMIAAYLIGFEVPQDKFRTSIRIVKPSEKSTDTGCVIGWDTYIAGANPGQKLRKIEHWYPTDDNKGKWERATDKAPLSINPLTWNQSTEKADKKMNLGAVHVTFSGSRPRWKKMYGDKAIGLCAAGLSKPYLHEVSAQRGKDGFLYISEPSNASFRTVLLPGGNYHNYDYALFYMNMRQNIRDRLNAFLS